jgi:CRISPR-associated endonuclease/helicase Cas3
MITLHLTGQQEKVAPENPWKLKQWPLYHQLRTYQALQNPDVHLVVNSYNTGTGKTRAALLHLYALNGQKKDVLLIAPTNALLNQHAEDVRAFVQTNQLDYKVVAVTAETIRKFNRDLVAQGDYEKLRLGETLFRLTRNYREFFPDEQQRQGLVLVVNPDIFYYALMYRYSSHDERNLFQQFLTAFSYIIIDEFHYYDQKQLASFLFFFAISQAMGYFARRGRKICLLSATPNAHVVRYLNNLFQQNWQHLSPDNEPRETASYDTVSTLTPLTLTAYAGSITDWGKAHVTTLREWLHQDKLDGAIISDSLQRINELYATLIPHLTVDKMGRITGPERESDRQIATGRPLILATPTVDIGYNFDKLDKRRQNLDFIINEARFGDDLIQRIGRAGRILGKPETNLPAQAIVLLSESALDVLRPYAGQTLTRAQFRTIISERQDALPQKHNLTGYIRSWAITEVFYPIYRTYNLVLPDVKERLDNLYQTLYDLFETRGSSSKFLSGYFKRYYQRKVWLKQTEDHPINFNLETAQHVADWYKFIGNGEYKPGDIQPHLGDENVLAYPEQQAELRRFVASQYHLTRSLFQFRDSFDGPTAVLYDPTRLLSSQEITEYDLFHVVSNFDVQWFEDHQEFRQLCKNTDLTGAFYGQLLRHRQPLLDIEFCYKTQETRSDFARQWEGRPIALNGFTVRGHERRGDFASLDHRITTVIRDSFLPILLICPEMKGHAIHTLKNSGLYSRKLIIDFADQQNVQYMAYVGKSAWLAFPELQRGFKIKERMSSEAIII